MAMTHSESGHPNEAIGVRTSVYCLMLEAFEFPSLKLSGPVFLLSFTFLLRGRNFNNHV